MPLIWKLTMIALVFSTWSGVPSYAQLGGGQPDAAKILNSMPPDVLMKVQTLAQILQQGIKDGTVTEAEIRQGIMSGRLAEKLKQLSPDADRLLDDVSTATKEGNGPGEDSLLPLLGGLGISPN